MAISLRQTRLYLLKILRVYNWLAGALAIIFLLFALYRAYLAMEAGESFSSFYDGLFPPLLALVLVSSFLPPSPSGNHPYTHQEKGLTHSYDSTH